jgi:hypothetical protein
MPESQVNAIPMGRSSPAKTDTVTDINPEEKILDVESLIERHKKTIEQNNDEEYLKKECMLDLKKHVNNFVDHIQKKNSFPATLGASMNRYENKNKNKNKMFKMLNNLYFNNLEKELRSVMTERIKGSENKLYIKITKKCSYYYLVEVGLVEEQEQKQKNNNCIVS